MTTNSLNGKKKKKIPDMEYLLISVYQHASFQDIDGISLSVSWERMHTISSHKLV